MGPGRKLGPYSCQLSTIPDQRSKVESGGDDSPGKTWLISWRLVCRHTAVFSGIVFRLQPCDCLLTLIVIAEIPKYKSGPFPLPGYVLHLNPVIRITTNPVVGNVALKSIISFNAFLAPARCGRKQQGKCGSAQCGSKHGHSPIGAPPMLPE